MQLESFEVDGLFGNFNHRIKFSSDVDSKNRASVTIIHGLNGVGKSTLLRMLNGMMQLDFSEFRKVPFASAKLRFNSGEILVVQPDTTGNDQYLKVAFCESIARLHPEHSGPYEEKFQDEVETFRAEF